MIEKVYLFANGRVQVFNDRGEVMENFCGKACDVLPEIMKYIHYFECFIGSYYHGVVDCSKAEFQEFAAQFV